MKTNRTLAGWLMLLALTTSTQSLPASPLGTAFTYQGRLSSGANAADGIYDFRFSIYDSVSAGAQVGSALTNAATGVTNGLFTVTLDFGSVFDGNARWLEIGVRSNGAAVNFTALAPRQSLTPTPYASYAPSAGSATVATTANGVAAGSITSAALAPGAVTAPALAPGAVSQLGTPTGTQTNALQVSANGWVGIGTSNALPAAALEIAGGTSFLTPVVYAEVADGAGSFTGLSGASSAAFSTNLLAVAGPLDHSVTLADTSGDTLGFLYCIRNGQSAFTNMGYPSSVAFSTNRLLAIASPASNAVTLVDVSTPSAPVWRSVMRDGVNNFNFLAGANTVAFSTNNLLAIAATNDHSVSLVTVANPASPVLAGYMQNPYNGFTNLAFPSALAFSGNLLAIASKTSNAVTIVDVSNPGNPLIRSSVRHGQSGIYGLMNPMALAWNSNLLAVGIPGGLNLLNVNNPANPTSYSIILNGQNGVSLLDNPKGLAIFQRNGRTLLAVCSDNNNAVSLFDVTDPYHPARRGVFVNGQPGVDALNSPQSIAVNANGRLAVAAKNSSAVTLLGLADQQAGLVVDNWVGIGTTNPPVAALDVNGDVLFENASFFQAQATHIALGQNTLAGGSYSIAMGYATIANGSNSMALGSYSTANNSYAMAAGRRAKALHQGAFVWADSQDADFTSTTNDQFLIRAAGGVGINKNNPATTLDVNGTATASSMKVDSTDANSGTLSPGIAFGAGLTGEGIASKRTTGTGWAGLDFYTASNLRMRVDNNGNVGIGTNNPQSALHVNGTITATGFSGSGAGLSNLPLSAVSAAVLTNNQSGVALGGTFSGNGASLTNIPATALVAVPPGMVLIPAGSFTMGNSIGDSDISDANPTNVMVSAFYMDVNLVSWSQWQSVYFWATNQGYGFVNAGAGKAANHPVQTVDWYDCVKWCNARSQQAGKTPVYYTDAGLTRVYTNGETPNVFVNWSAKGYRLPTEAEWEKAARGGLSGQRFTWGNVINQNLANYYGATASYAYDLGPDGYNAVGSVGGTSPATSPVGSFAPNGYGLYDMAGNVVERCWDWYGTPYAGGTDPRGPASGSYRVLRGGSCSSYAINCRTAFRFYYWPGGGNFDVGFRSVLPPGQ